VLQLTKLECCGAKGSCVVCVEIRPRRTLGGAGGGASVVVLPSSTDEQRHRRTAGQQRQTSATEQLPLTSTFSSLAVHRYPANTPASGHPALAVVRPTVTSYDGSRGKGHVKDDESVSSSYYRRQLQTTQL